MCDWSKLPDDLIARIISLLPLQDYIRFSAVCLSWFLVAKKKYHRPTSQVPWLLLSDSSAINTRTVYSLYEDQLYDMNLPDIYGRRCCGSSHGWLVTIDDDLVVHLCHPFSKARIRLPALPDWTEPCPPWTKTPAYYPPELFPYRDFCGFKVIISADPSNSEDFIVMALLRDIRTLAFWRPGHFRWFDLQTPSPRGGPRVEDAIWYDNKFYAINIANEILVVDPCSDPVPRKFYFPINEEHFEVEGAADSHLVDFMGELLVVYKISNNLPDYIVSHRNRTVRIKVLKVDFLARRLDPLDTIGDYALFLGTNQSVAIPACKFKGCRKNCVYFTGGNGDWPDLTGDAGIYNLSDDTVEPFSPNDVFCPAASPSVWFDPIP